MRGPGMATKSHLGRFVFLELDTPERSPLLVWLKRVFVFVVARGW